MFLADFLAGGIIGYAVENFIGSRNPTVGGLPFRPVWGLGAALATRDFLANFLIALAIEVIAFEMFPVWDFSSKGNGALAHGAVYIPYTFAYATGMLCYRCLTMGPDAPSQREYPSTSTKESSMTWQMIVELAMLALILTGVVITLVKVWDK